MMERAEENIYISDSLYRPTREGVRGRRVALLTCLHTHTHTHTHTLTHTHTHTHSHTHTRASNSGVLLEVVSYISSRLFFQDFSSSHRRQTCQWLCNKTSTLPLGDSNVCEGVHGPRGSHKDV